MQSSASTAVVTSGYRYNRPPYLLLSNRHLLPLLPSPRRGPALSSGGVGLYILVAGIIICALSGENFTFGTFGGIVAIIVGALVLAYALITGRTKTFG